FDALADLQPELIHDAHLMSLQRPAATDEAQRLWIIGRRGLRFTLEHERLAPDAGDQWSTPHRWKEQSQRTLRKPIDWRHGIGSKATLREALGETRDGIGAHPFSAVHCQPPRA